MCTYTTTSGRANLPHSAGAAARRWTRATGAAELQKTQGRHGPSRAHAAHAGVDGRTTMGEGSGPETPEKGPGRVQMTAAKSSRGASRGGQPSAGARSSGPSRAPAWPRRGGGVCAVSATAGRWRQRHHGGADDALASGRGRFWGRFSGGILDLGEEGDLPPPPSAVGRPPLAAAGVEGTGEGGIWWWRRGRLGSPRERPRGG